MRKKNPVYERGRYKLIYDVHRNGSLRSPYFQIQWYDAVARRNRSKSTGTSDREAAEQQLDALYLLKERGQAVCPSCGQAVNGSRTYLLTEAIELYLAARSNRVSINAIRARLAHVLKYVAATGLISTTCLSVDDDWVEGFRAWASSLPVVVGDGSERVRAPGTVEASVRQMAAVINFAKVKGHTPSGATFTPKKPTDVSVTPTFRATVPILASMFVYCSSPDRKPADSDDAYLKRIKGREQLLRFLQISVATWARPDAAHDVSVDPIRGQWDPAAETLNLNPRNRTQTRKYRPIVPVPRQLVGLLNEADGFYVKVGSVRKAFEEMQRNLSLPGERQAGLKLIRRSIAQLARKRLGEADWIEGRQMLGHHRPTVSDNYAPSDPSYLSRAQAVTEEIIAEIIALAPLAFASSGKEKQLKSHSIKGDKS